MTVHGEVRVKLVRRGGQWEVVPEFEACKEIARKSGRPLKDIYGEIRSLAVEEA
jgi:uncharacterized protein (DUF111 family)